MMHWLYHDFCADWPLDFCLAPLGAFLLFMACTVALGWVQWLKQNLK